ncbi:MAG: acetate/propionate family kinase [Vitreoscilla sp.]|nr:acetate/propionate family kinase [Vitreoscilla sp.]
MTAVVLAVNAGSSSLKFGLYPDEGPAAWSGAFEGLEPGGAARWREGRADWQALQVDGGTSPFDAALALLLRALAKRPVRLAAVSHRIVHGGESCTAPRWLDDDTLATLHRLSPLAPLHQPHNLAGVAAFARALPDVPHVGCFDTAFHSTLPPTERALPLPPAITDTGVRRYGFHGLSYDYLVQELRGQSRRAEGRMLLAHLGNGASLCATLGGCSIASTMGFSALDGLMMGTRSGSIDPGVLLHLWRQGWDLPGVERLLYQESGLKGVSGLSADMRSLRASADPAAQRAIALFTHRVKREAGALLALLGGMDVLAFTGGIGEHDATLRSDVAGAFAFAGAQLDAQANEAAQGDRVVPVHAAHSNVEIWVVPTDEGRVAARAAFKLLT